MILIDNSTAGRVADVHRLLPESGLHIIGEHFLPIQFQLMGLLGSSVAQASRVLSHVHALGQCRDIIRKHGLEPVVAHDTAGAAKIVAADGSAEQVALAPSLAAEMYGLEIFEADVSDSATTTPASCCSRLSPTRSRAVRKGHHLAGVQDPVGSGGALQGADRLCHQWRQHHQARELHYRRPAYGRAVLYRYRRRADDTNVAIALQDLAYSSEHVRVLVIPGLVLPQVLSADGNSAGQHRVRASERFRVRGHPRLDHKARDRIPSRSRKLSEPRCALISSRLYQSARSSSSN